MNSSDVTVMRLPSGGALHAAGTPGATPLLLLHGVGGGAWSWKPQSDAAASERRTYVWEARGHGIARAVDDAGLGDYYVDAREALEAILAIERRAPVIAGHSMGGLLAIALATDEPQRVAALFLVEPVYSTGDGYGHFGSLWAGKAALTLLAPLLRSYERDGAVARTLSRWMFAGSFEDRTRMESAWREQRRQVPVEYPRMLRESFGRPAGFPLRNFASEFAMPVSVLEGSVGRTGPRFPDLVASARAALGERFIYEWIPGGHYLQLDRPDEVNARLAACVRGADRSTGAVPA